MTKWKFMVYRRSTWTGPGVFWTNKQTGSKDNNADSQILIPSLAVRRGGPIDKNGSKCIRIPGSSDERRTGNCRQITPWRPTSPCRDKIRVKMFLLNLVRQGLAYKHGWWILQFLDKNSGSPWNNKERNWPSWAEWFDSQLIHAKHIESNDQLWSLVVSWESKVLGSPLFQGEFSILKKEIIARPILYAHPDFVSAAVYLLPLLPTLWPHGPHSILVLLTLTSRCEF